MSEKRVVIWEGKSQERVIFLITQTIMVTFVISSDPAGVLDTWRSFAMRFSAVFFGCSPSSCCCKSIHARRGEFLIQSMTFIYLSGNGHHAPLTTMFRMFTILFLLLLLCWDLLCIFTCDQYFCLFDRRVILQYTNNVWLQHILLIH